MPRLRTPLRPPRCLRALQASAGRRPSPARGRTALKPAIQEAAPCAHAGWRRRPNKSWSVQVCVHIVGPLAGRTPRPYRFVGDVPLSYPPGRRPSPARGNEAERQALQRLRSSRSGSCWSRHPRPPSRRCRRLPPPLPRCRSARCTVAILAATRPRSARQAVLAQRLHGQHAQLEAALAGGSRRARGGGGAAGRARDARRGIVALHGREERRVAEAATTRRQLGESGAHLLPAEEALDLGGAGRAARATWNVVCSSIRGPLTEPSTVRAAVDVAKYCSMQSRQVSQTLAVRPSIAEAKYLKAPVTTAAGPHEPLCSGRLRCPLHRVSPADPAEVAARLASSHTTHHTNHTAERRGSHIYCGPQK